MSERHVRNGERDRRMVERRVAKVGYFGTERRVGDRRAPDRRRPSEGAGRDPLTRAFWIVGVTVIFLLIDVRVFDGFYLNWLKSSLAAWGEQTRDWSAHVWLN